MPDTSTNLATTIGQLIGLVALLVPLFSWGFQLMRLPTAARPSLREIGGTAAIGLYRGGIYGAIIGTVGYALLGAIVGAIVGVRTGVVTDLLGLLAAAFVRAFVTGLSGTVGFGIVGALIGLVTALRGGAPLVVGAALGLALGLIVTVPEIVILTAMAGIVLGAVIQIILNDRFAHPAAA